MPSPSAASPPLPDFNPNSFLTPSTSRSTATARIRVGWAIIVWSAATACSWGIRSCPIIVCSAPNRSLTRHTPRRIVFTVACPHANSAFYRPIVAISIAARVSSFNLIVLQPVQPMKPETGCVARAVISLSKGLQQHGVQIEIVALDKPDSPWLRDQSLTVHALGPGLTRYRYSRALPKWLKEHRDKFDCVIVHGIWQHHSFAVWQRFHKTAVPYFVFSHGMLDPWFKRTFPLKHLKKWLYWPWTDYRVLRDAAAVIFTSEEERSRARRSFWLYRAKEKISPLGIEEPRPAGPEARHLFLAKFPEVEKMRMLLFLGRIHPKKGCDLAIDALPRRASGEAVLLVIAGPDQVGWLRRLRVCCAAMGGSSG